MDECSGLSRGVESAPLEDSTWLSCCKEERALADAAQLAELS